MKRLFTLSAIAAVVIPSLCTAADVKLAERETILLPALNVVAAFAVDPGTVEARVIGGQVSLLARHAGQTLVTVVTPSGVETFVVQVEIVPNRFMDLEAAYKASRGLWSLGYDSNSRRSTTSINMPFQDGKDSLQLRLQASHDGRFAVVGGSQDAWALPEVSLKYKTPDYSLVVLDDTVDVSPLTIERAVLRGAHFRQGDLKLHAGVSTRTAWSSLLVPHQGDRAVGASYRFKAGGLQLIPSLHWLPDSRSPEPGMVSLGLAQGSDKDALQLRGELAWSSKPGASFDFSLRPDGRLFWLKGAYRPKAFATLDGARPAGKYVDGGWSERLDASTTLDLTLSMTRLDLAQQNPESSFARADLRFAPTPGWNTSMGLSGSRYHDFKSSSLNRSTLSLGAGYEQTRYGVSSLYRYQQTSASARGGHGARISLRGNSGGWHARAYADAQQQSPSVSLLLQNRPDLARAMAELGLTANSPDDLVRLLRDNAGLLNERGVSIGAVQIDELRVMGGMDLSWRGQAAINPQIGVRLNTSRGQGGMSQSRTSQASAYANWRVFGDTDLDLSYSRWSYRAAGSSSTQGNSVQLMLRTRLSPVGMPGRGGRRISGRIFRDDGATGVDGPDQPTLAGVEVVLDGSRRTVTDRNGRYVFEAPGDGNHRVTAVLPIRELAYFTTPSTISVNAGSNANFALSFAAARLSGRVLSDAGLPLDGVSLRVEGSQSHTITTDSSGVFRFAGPSEEVKLSLLPDSLPPGYELVDLSSVLKRLAAGAPVVSDFTVRAQRVLEGRVIGGGGGAFTVRAIEASRSVMPDASGRFVLRGLPAGPLTILVKSRDGEASYSVQMPTNPGVMSGVELSAPCARGATSCSATSLGKADHSAQRHPVSRTKPPPVRSNSATL
jgi:hypothetical protein